MKCRPQLFCAVLSGCLALAALSASVRTLDAAGGASLLDALWSPKSVTGAPAEKKSVARASPDDSPPARLTPRLSASPPPLATKNAVRRVELPPSSLAVALTFDLCELATKTAGYDAELVDFLRAASVRATFFVGGKWMRSHPERAMQLMADPCFEIGNHAWTHGNFGVLGEAAAREQLLWTQAQYELLREEIERRAHRSGKIVDVKAAMAAIAPLPRLFRFPYGRCRPEALELLARHGLTGIEWDVPAEDDALGATQAAAKALSKIRPGSIVLLHANGVPKNTAALVKILVPALRAKGYALLTVGELLGRGPVEAPEECYDETPGDTLIFDQTYGDGTRRRK